MLIRILGVIAVLLLLTLATGALLTLRKGRDAENRFPPLGPIVEVGNATLHYVDEGTGPALVLLHGAGANLRDFEHGLAPRLRDRYRVIRVDRPGSGYSRAGDETWLSPDRQAEAVLELLDRLGVDQAVWAGHSWGGSVVMAALLASPERVTGGVLLAGAAYPWTGGVDLTDELPAWPIAGPLLTRTVITPVGYLLLEQGIEAVFAPNVPTPGYREETGVELYLRPSQFKATAQDIRMLSDHLVTQAPRYASIRQPLLMIHGEADTIVPAWNHTDRLERLLPNARALRLPDTGHAPHHTHADQVATAIDRFVGRILGVRS